MLLLFSLEIQLNIEELKLAFGNKREELHYSWKDIEKDIFVAQKLILRTPPQDASWEILQAPRHPGATFKLVLLSNSINNWIYVVLFGSNMMKSSQKGVKWGSGGWFFLFGVKRLLCCVGRRDEETVDGEGERRKESAVGGVYAAHISTSQELGLNLTLRKGLST